MEGINWIDLGTLVGVLGAAFGLKHIVTDQYNRYIARRDAKDLDTNVWHDWFKDYDLIYSNLRRVIHDTDADRVLIIQNVNGGGKPHMDSTIYSSVLYEEYMKGPLGSMKKNWVNQELDRDYLRMLSEMDKTGSMVITVDKLDEEGMLFGAYFKQGIVGSKIYKISDKHDRYIYLVANYTSKIPGIEESDVYRVVVNNLKALFNRD